ncbi:hypothetical protein [Mycolicibacterium fortuitum]
MPAPPNEGDLIMHAKMLGPGRQPCCGKCCGERIKAGNTKQKRAQRRAQHQKFKAELAAGQY